MKIRYGEIRLTVEQIETLAQLIEAYEQDRIAGKPGVLLGQLLTLKSGGVKVRVRHLSDAELRRTFGDERVDAADRDAHREPIWGVPYNTILDGLIDL